MDTTEAHGGERGNKKWLYGQKLTVEGSVLPATQKSAKAG